MWLVLLMYALFASAFTVGKITLGYVDPFFLTGVRMLFAGLLLLVFLLAKGEKISCKRALLPLIIMLSFFNVFITNAFEFWGLQFMETGKTSLIYSFSPLFAIGLSYLFFGEKMTPKKWLGLFVGLVGFSLVFLLPSENSTLIGPISLPEIAVSIGAFTAVVGWLTMKRLMEKHNFSFLTANMLSFLIGGTFSLVTSAFVETWQPLPYSSFLPFFLGMVYIAVIHNVVCYNLYAYSMKRYSVTFLTFAGFSAPLFTAAYGWFFLHEKLSLFFFLSLALIIAGMILYSREERVKAS